MSHSRLASDLATWVWEADDAGARAMRAALTPIAAAFGQVVARRNRRFDAPPERGTVVRRAPLPALSIGNLTVGGTGKTPMAAWCARSLRAKGANPAIVLRGYGDDEWRVHMLLNPGVPVFVAPDRLDGMLVARTRGADCAVLDDAFQHRQAPRVCDLVLVSADRWHGAARLLPAGPFREPLASLRRADAAVITVKAADLSRVEALAREIERAAPETPIVVVRFALGDLRLAATLPVLARDGSVQHKSRDATGLLSRPASWLSGRTVVATSGIGDPASFAAQLARAGAVVRPIQFTDHHAFSARDAELLARSAEGTDGVVCTLKDAVKLAQHWPRVAPPLWYVSQSVVVERGAPALDRALARVLAARVAIAPTAG